LKPRGKGLSRLRPELRNNASPRIITLILEVKFFAKEAVLGRRDVILLKLLI